MFNNLPFLIYVAEVIDSLSVLAGVIATLCSMFVVGTVFIQLISDDNLSSVYSRVWVHCRRAVWATFALLLLSILLPSKTVIYTYAAVQVGAEVVKMQSVQDVAGEVGGDAIEMLKLLKKYLADQVKTSKE